LFLNSLSRGEKEHISLDGNNIPTKNNLRTKKENNLIHDSLKKYLDINLTMEIK
jgi:hypothetical protein